MRESNDLQAEMWNQDTAGFPFTGSTKYDVRSGIYGNVTYGPLWYNWVKTGGKEGIEPPDYMKQMMQLVDHAKTVGPADQAKDAQQIMKLWVDNMVEIGTVGLTATDQGVVVVNAKMKNVPQNLTKDWPLRSPGNGRPETWFFTRRKFLTRWHSRHGDRMRQARPADRDSPSHVRFSNASPCLERCVMLRFIVQRLLLLPILLVLFSIIVFWLVQAPPGDLFDQLHRHPCFGRFLHSRASRWRRSGTSSGSTNRCTFGICSGCKGCSREISVIRSSTSDPMPS